MVEVTFIQPDGSAQTFAGSEGDTVMDVALDNNVVGIEAQCGGGCTCCTCHCWIPSPWFEALPAPHKDETDLLVYAWRRGAYSRLSCQIFLEPSLSGIRIEVPAEQS